MPETACAAGNHGVRRVVMDHVRRTVTFDDTAAGGPGKDFAIVPFDRDAHMSFLAGTFKDSLREAGWPWSLVPPDAALKRLRRTMASPGALTVVACSLDDRANLWGWAVTVPGRNAVVHAYVKYAYRQEYGVGRALVTAGGVDPAKPTPVRFWTRATARIQVKHPDWHLVFDVEDAT